MSLGATEKRYFQTYPSPLVPAAVGSKSVKVGSSLDTFPFRLSPDDPLSIHT